MTYKFMVADRTTRHCHQGYRVVSAASLELAVVLLRVQDKNVEPVSVVSVGPGGKHNLDHVLRQIAGGHTCSQHLSS